MKQLAISKELKLPIDAVTQKFGLLGRTGSGKSYAASKLAEEMLDAKAQIIALDPVGVWWGLRVGADGQNGFKIPVFGGLHGDIPLEPAAGAIIADLIVDRGISAVLDVSQFLVSEQSRFAFDFATRFFHRKKAAPSAVHLFIEECQEFIPQNISGGSSGFESKMLGAFERLIKLGRNFGIGASLISQRPQEVNKKALNQTECLFAFQMTGPQERKTIKTWIAEKGLEDDIADTLPHLKVGEAHVWSPQWLRISETIRIAEKRTADVSSTPKHGAKVIEPKELSPVDLEALREKMSATIEKAKAEDPRELRKQLAAARKMIVDMQLQLERAPAATVETKTVSILKEAHVNRFESAANKISEAAATCDKFVRELLAAIHAAPAADAGMQKKLHSCITRTQGILTHKPNLTGGKRAQDVGKRAQNSPTVLNNSPEFAELTRPRQRILNVLATFESLGVMQPAKGQIAVFSGQSPTSSGYTNNLGALRTAGLIHYPQPGCVSLTEAGRAVAVNESSFSSLRDLHECWFRLLPRPRAEILRAVINHGNAIAKQELAETVGQSPTSSGYTNNLGALRSLGLIEYPQPGYVAATDLLFPNLPS